MRTTRRWFGGEASLVLVLAGCAAATSTQNVEIVVTPDAAAPADASVTTSTPVSTVPASEPWCTTGGHNMPCVFWAYGTCFSPSDDGAVQDTCPTEPPPSFMTQPRACGRRANERVVAVETQYVEARDRPRCSAIDTTWANVPHEDRACTADSDCGLVEVGCFHTSLTRKALKLAKYANAPCPNPAAGACRQSTNSVRCQSGCCVMGGDSPFGTIDFAYPKITPP